VNLKIGQKNENNYFNISIYWTNLSKFFAGLCFYCPVKEGTKTETKHYNAKDKIQSTDKQTILSKKVTGKDVSVTVKSESYDDKEKLQFSKDLTFECKNGVFFFDMQNFIDPKTMEGFKDMQVKMTATNLEIPASPSAGNALPDGNIQINVSNQGITMMNMTIKIYNRKVEALEKLTTPAGTFDCMKITYDVETKMMFKIQSKGVEWIAKEVGVVRSENYDSKGKLIDYSVLSFIK